MDRRARLLTTEDVLEELELDNDFDADEPVMPGSDDEFSDLEDIDDDDEDIDIIDHSATPNSPPSNAQGSTLPTWSSTLTPVTIQPFTSPVGPKVSIPESPSDTFQLMFTPGFLDTIVTQTNLYAKEVMGEDKYRSWVKITREELRAYIGFCILMGINHLPAMDDY